MKAFVNHTGNVPLFQFPSMKRLVKLCDLPPGAVVDVDEWHDGWTQVTYRTNPKTWHGYSHAAYIERWVEPEKHDVIRIRTATPNESDFAQNLIFLDNVQFNLCGEFSVLYCAKWREFDIDDWLEEWKIKETNAFSRIFKLGRSLPVGASDLALMLHSFEGYPVEFMSLAQLFDYQGKPLFTPARLASALQMCRVIIGCKIGVQFGRLQSSGIPHWVVIESMEPEGRGGLVKLYNPASNSVETYTWEQIAESCTRNPYGLAVPR
jgi:hypothetical protein